MSYRYGWLPMARIRTTRTCAGCGASYNTVDADPGRLCLDCHHAQPDEVKHYDPLIYPVRGDFERDMLANGYKKHPDRDEWSTVHKATPDGPLCGQPADETWQTELQGQVTCRLCWKALRALKQ